MCATNIRMDTIRMCLCHSHAAIRILKMQQFKKNLGEEMLVILGGLLGAIGFLFLIGLATRLLVILKKNYFSL